MAVEAVRDVWDAWRLRRMQHVPALGFERVTPQLGPGGHRPNVSRNAELLSEQGLCAQRLVHDGAAREHLRARPLAVRAAPAQQVHAAHDAVTYALAVGRL